MSKIKDFRKTGIKSTFAGVAAGAVFLAGCAAPSVDHVVEKYDELSMDNYRVEATMTASVMNLEAAEVYPITATFIGDYTENYFHESVLGSLDTTETYGEKTVDGYSLYSYSEYEWVHTLAEDFDYAFADLDITGENTEKDGDTIIVSMSSDELLELPEMDAFEPVLKELYKHADQASVKNLMRGRQVKAYFDAETYTLKSIEMPDIGGALDTAEGEEKGADVSISFHAEIKNVEEVAEEDAMVPENVLKNFYDEASSDEPVLDEEGHEIKTDLEINEDEGFYGAYNGHYFGFSTPVPWSAFEEDGWEFTEYNPGDTEFCMAENEKYPGTRLFVYGEDGEIVRTEDIRTYGVYQYRCEAYEQGADLPPFTWIGGLTTDCTSEDVRAMYGEPINESEYVMYDDTEAHRMEYNPIDHLFLYFRFENGKLDEIGMKNYTNTWYI